MTQPTLNDLHSNDCSQELRYYPLAVNLNRCVESCNTLEGLSSRECVPKIIIWILRILLQFHQKLFQQNCSNKKYLNKRPYNKMYFNKFLHFTSLFIIALLIAVSICFFFIKY